MTALSRWPYIWMLCAALAFAAMGTLGHASAKYCDWRVVALARTSLALFFALLLAAAARARLAIWQPRTLWVRSLAGSVSLVCTFYALSRLPVADVLTLTNIFPIWVALLSWPLLGAWPSRPTWIAVASGVAGVILIQQPHWAEARPDRVERLFATLAALVASFSSAMAMIGLHRVRGVDIRAIVVHFSAVATVVCLALLFLPGERLIRDSGLSGAAWAMLLGVGVSATIGQVFLTKAFSAGPPARISVIGLSQVGFGMCFDMLFWGRTFDASTLLGMTLLVAPTAWLLARSRGVSMADE